ncbi:MAG TPA: hypothetical protein PK941_14215, partial [Paludibacter sp.]|nr:hypothetical protein [Paludibacter sp.]
GRWAHPNSIKAEILRTTELIGNRIISAGATSVDYDADIITGSSVMELSSKLNASANVAGGGWGFKGEAGASFDRSDFKSNKYEYAIAYINIAKRNVATLQSAQTLRQYYMTPEAYREINGLNRLNNAMTVPVLILLPNRALINYSMHTAPIWLLKPNWEDE